MLQGKIGAYSAMVHNGAIRVQQEIMEYLNIFFFQGLHFDDKTKEMLGCNLRKFSDNVEEDHEHDSNKIVALSKLM